MSQSLVVFLGPRCEWSAERIPMTCKPSVGSTVGAAAWRQVKMDEHVPLCVVPDCLDPRQQLVGVEVLDVVLYVQDAVPVLARQVLSNILERVIAIDAHHSSMWYSLQRV